MATKGIRKSDGQWNVPPPFRCSHVPIPVGPLAENFPAHKLDIVLLQRDHFPAR